MIERADAVIVGGGPAGSTCARALVAAGWDVLVVDRARFPRDKPCAGWVTPEAVAALDLPLGEYARGRVCQPIEAFRTGLIGGPTLVTRFDRPVSHGVCRVELDDFLLRRSGARLLLGEPVTSLRRTRDRWIVNDRIEAPVLVGAGGHQCPVARALGARAAGEAAVVAREVEFALSEAQQARCRIDPATPLVRLCRDLRGYGWVLRKGGRINVGLGRLDTHDLPRHVRDFAAGLADEGLVPADLPPRWNGHAYLLRESSRRRVAGDGALLVGDAAGLASAVSGEGIRAAAESGAMAAAALVAAGSRREQAPADYAARLDARFPRAGAAASRLPRAVAVPIVSALVGWPWFARRVLVERWFLRAA